VGERLLVVGDAFVVCGSGFRSGDKEVDVVSEGRLAGREWRRRLKTSTKGETKADC
jgi:hypothetical protein